MQVIRHFYAPYKHVGCILNTAVDGHLWAPEFTKTKPHTTGVANNLAFCREWLKRAKQWDKYGVLVEIRNDGGGWKTFLVKKPVGYDLEWYPESIHRLLLDSEEQC